MPPRDRSSNSFLEFLRYEGENVSVFHRMKKKGVKQQYDIRLVLTFVTEFFNLT